MLSCGREHNRPCLLRFIEKAYDKLEWHLLLFMLTHLCLAILKGIEAYIVDASTCLSIIQANHRMIQLDARRQPLVPLILNDFISWKFHYSLAIFKGNEAYFIDASTCLSIIQAKS